MRSFFDFDAKLKTVGKDSAFVRYPSLSALPFDFSACNTNGVSDEQISHYEQMITKRLSSKFAVPSLIRSDYGQLINLDEAIDGIPECFRHTRPNKSVLKLGLNISADYNVTGDLFAMRAAAIIAVYNLAKQRGQSVQFDVCYGYFGFNGSLYSNRESHVRVMVPTPTVQLIKKVMSSDFWGEMIDRVVVPISGTAGYRLHAFPAHLKGKEFDFVLDRLETSDKDVEYARILEQITRLR